MKFWDKLKTHVKSGGVFPAALWAIYHLLACRLG